MALLDRLRSNTRLLERVALFDEWASLAPVSSPEQLFLQAVRLLQQGDLEGAKQKYRSLAALLGQPHNSEQLEPLRTLLHLSLWEGGEEDRQQVQKFLLRELELDFQAEAQPPPPPLALPDTAAAPDAGEPGEQLPCHVRPDEYSEDAFARLLDAAVPSAARDHLESWMDSSRLAAAAADGSLPWRQRLQLVRQGLMWLPLVPAGVLADLVRRWAEEDGRAAAGRRGGSAMRLGPAPRLPSAARLPRSEAVEWAADHWAQLTREQAVALRAALPGPPLGEDPDLDRPYLAALVAKAMDGPADEAEAAAATGTGEAAAAPAPWSRAAQEAAEAVALGRALELCQEVGPPADFMRLHVLHAQLLQQQRSAPCVDLGLFCDYMQLLGGAKWTRGPEPAGSGGLPATRPQAPPQPQQPQQPSQRPSPLPSPAVLGAQPLDQVQAHGGVYMLPEAELPDLLGGLPHIQSERQEEAREMLVALAWHDGASGKPALFTPEGPCPLAAAGLLLPQAWRDAAVAEGKLLGDRCDAAEAAAWGRLYGRHADLGDLRRRAELGFARASPRSYALDEAVELRLDVKNPGASGLEVKVYKLNAWAYYTSTEGREADLGLELAGVAPTRSVRVEAEAAGGDREMARRRVSVPLGLAGEPGVWLVEAVAGGQRVRARVQKGALRLTQRPSAAGQVLTVADEDWRQVQGVRVWCDGRELRHEPGGRQDAVVVPYARAAQRTPLVVAARLAGAPATADGSPEECVVLFPDFQRLPERYELEGQLFCVQEALIPGQTAQLRLRLALRLHGQLAPLQLLQELQLRVAAQTQDCASVAQAFRDLAPDPLTGELELSCTVPDGARAITAQLSARVLLALPGINGEPEWQDLLLDELLPGPGYSTLELEGASSRDWPYDVFLTCAPAAAGTGGAAAGEFALQVLGRAGEAPPVPQVLEVSLSHVRFHSSQRVRLRVRTGPGGVVRLGALRGVRQLWARVADEPGGAGGGCDPEPPWPPRSWQVARTSWWHGGLQREYAVPTGGSLELPLTPAAGQELGAVVLLQLVDPGGCGCCGGGGDGAASPAVCTDVTSGHLELLPASPPDAGVGCLGSGRASVARVHGLAAGLYRLVVPAMLLQPPQGQTPADMLPPQLGPGGDVELLIRVLPAAAAAAQSGEAPGAAPAPAAGGGEGDLPARPWLWEATPQGRGGPTVLRASPPRQLQIASLSCSVERGLRVELRGAAEQLADARLLVVLGRFLPDASLLDPGRIPPPGTTVAGSDSGIDLGVGGVAEQPCAPSPSCSYSGAARIDSGVAYVLQRRAAAAAGGRRPGSLLERPSLLVLPRCVRSAASGQSVLRGGDGGRLVERYAPGAAAKRSRALQKAAPARAASAAAPGPYPCVAHCAFSSSMGAEGMPGGGVLFGGSLPEEAEQDTPVLSFVAQPAAVLGGLQPDRAGVLQLPSARLQALLAASVGGAASLRGYSVACVAAHAPGDTALQFDSAWAGVGGALSPEEAAQPGARRDLGLTREVEDAVCAMVREVLPLAPPRAVTVPNAKACEVAAFGSIQQLYQLLSALLAAAEAGGQLPIAPSSDGGGVAGAGTDMARLLRRPCVPPGCQGERASALLRQWEPLLLSWPSKLGQVARLELLQQLGSAEAHFFLACKDPHAFDEMVLPLLRWKLPSQLCCLEQVLLLQATHGLPPIPWPADGDAQRPPWEPSYAAARDRLLERWGAPHRHARLTALEQVLLAALQSREALLSLAADMRARLQTPEEKRGAKRSWMWGPRRTLFDFAQLLCRQLELQQQEEERQGGQERQGRRQGDGGSDSDSSGGGGGEEEEGGHGGTDDWQEVLAQDYEGAYTAAVPPRPGGTPLQMQMAPMMEAAARPMGMRMMGLDAHDGAGPMMGRPAHGPGLVLQHGRMAADAADLAARQRVVAAAAASAHLAPKETKEWAEAGFWKYEAQQAPPELIPEADFWADLAVHLATSPEAPFLPTDVLGVAASTAAVVAALAAADLPWEGAPSAAGGLGCSRSTVGADLVLTPRAPCVLWARQLRPLGGSEAAVPLGGAAGEGQPPRGCSSSGGGGGSGSGGSSAAAPLQAAGGVVVTDRLYDPSCASWVDPETGEEVLLELRPSEHQQLAAGRPYCRSAVVTSIVGAEQRLELLLQVPQGAMPLGDSQATVGSSVLLQPFASHQLSLAFYFPEAGVFRMPPVSVVKHGRPAWVPSGPPAPLHVVPAPAAGLAALAAGGAGAPRPFDWQSFLRGATQEELLGFLRGGDLSLARLQDISPYCRDRGFFAAAVEALSRRRVCAPAVWKWAVAHMDGAALAQLLPLTALAERARRWRLPTPWLRLLPLEARDVGAPHLEFWPWINAYCRPIPRGDGAGDPDLPSVLADNAAIAKQWQQFLLELLFDPDRVAGGGGSGASGRLGLSRAAGAAVHLLLQDRLEEAEQLLAAAGLEQAAAAMEEGAPLRMQLDYLRLYLALRRPPPASAPVAEAAAAGGTAASHGPLSPADRVLAERYAHSTAARVWRKRFAELSSMAAEVERLHSPDAAAPQPGAAGAGAGAAPRPALLSLQGCEGGLLRLVVGAGLEELWLSAYAIDTELLFTTEPFGALPPSNGGGPRAPGPGGAGAAPGAAAIGRAAYVQPSARVALRVADGARAAEGVAAGADAVACAFDLDAVLPPRLAGQSLLLEVEGGGVRRALPRFASLLEVNVNEAQGVLQAFYRRPPGPGYSGGGGGGFGSPTLLPAAGAYVKVFAQARDDDDDEWFYKDGTADLRGKFDYFTLTSTADMRRAARFSLLVADPELGAVVLQAAAPPRH